MSECESCRLVSLGKGHAAQCYECQADTIAALQATIERLRHQGREFIWGEENPKEWQSMEAQLVTLKARVEELEAKYEHAYNALLAEQKENAALVEVARAVEKRHKRKVSLNGLLYHEYESEAVEALAALIGGGE